MISPEERVIPFILQSLEFNLVSNTMEHDFTICASCTSGDYHVDERRKHVIHSICVFGLSEDLAFLDEGKA